MKSSNWKSWKLQILHNWNHASKFWLIQWISDMVMHTPQTPMIVPLIGEISLAIWSSDRNCSGDQINLNDRRFSIRNELTKLSLVFRLRLHRFWAFLSVFTKGALFHHRVHLSSTFRHLWLLLSYSLTALFSLSFCSPVAFHSLVLSLSPRGFALQNLECDRFLSSFI